MKKHNFEGKINSFSLDNEFFSFKGIAPSNFFRRSLQKRVLVDACLSTVLHHRSELAAAINFIL
jgi:hypothetical protein